MCVWRLRRLVRAPLPTLRTLRTLYTRQERSAAARRIGQLLDRCPIELLELRPGEHAADRALGDPFAGAQEISAVGGAQRMVGVVGGEQHAMAGGGERADL